MAETIYKNKDIEFTTDDIYIGKNNANDLNFFLDISKYFNMSYSSFRNRDNAWGAGILDNEFVLETHARKNMRKRKLIYIGKFDTILNVCSSDDYLFKLIPESAIFDFRLIKFNIANSIKNIKRNLSSNKLNNLKFYKDLYNCKHKHKHKHKYPYKKAKPLTSIVGSPFFKSITKYRSQSLLCFTR